MIKRFENIRFIKGNSSLGIHLKINAENDFSISMVEVSRKKDSLNIISTNSLLPSIQKLKEFNKSNFPVNLTITGKGVLSKTIKASAEDDLVKIINKLFPNLSIQDFYIQKNLIDENLYYISIIRKSLLDSILEEFYRNKIYISSLSISPIIIQNIIPFIDENQIELSEFSIKINENKIHEILNVENNKTEKTYKIGSEFIESDLLIPYASTINFFVPSTYNESNLNEIIVTSRDEYTAKQIFTYGGWFVLLFVLFILLFNYMFFIHYQNKRDLLSNKSQIHKNLVTQLAEYKTELERKTTFLNKNKILYSSRVSYYADQIGLLLPKEITLTVLNVFPIEKGLKNKQEAKFIYDKIKVSGITQNGIILNDWIKELKNLKWIKRIEITSYTQENINTYGEFSLEIILNTEY